MVRLRLLLLLTIVCQLTFLVHCERDKREDAKVQPEKYEETFLARAGTLPECKGQDGGGGGGNDGKEEPEPAPSKAPEAEPTKAAEPQPSAAPDPKPTEAAQEPTNAAEPTKAGKNDKPDKGGDKPDEGGDKPDKGGDKPDKGGDKPDKGGDKPDKGGDKPDKGGDKPDKGGDKPDKGGDKPDKGGDKPDKGGKPDKGDKPDKGGKPGRVTTRPRPPFYRFRRSTGLSEACIAAVFKSLTNQADFGVIAQLYVLLKKVPKYDFKEMCASTATHYGCGQVIKLYFSGKLPTLTKLFDGDIKPKLIAECKTWKETGACLSTKEECESALDTPKLKIHPLCATPLAAIKLCEGVYTPQCSKIVHDLCDAKTRPPECLAYVKKMAPKVSQFIEIVNDYCSKQNETKETEEICQTAVDNAQNVDLSTYFQRHCGTDDTVVSSGCQKIVKRCEQTPDDNHCKSVLKEQRSQVFNEKACEIDGDTCDAEYKLNCIDTPVLDLCRKLLKTNERKLLDRWNQCQKDDRSGEVGKVCETVSQMATSLCWGHLFNMDGCRKVISTEYSMVKTIVGCILILVTLVCWVGAFLWYQQQKRYWKLWSESQTLRKPPTACVVCKLFIVCNIS